MVKAKAATGLSMALQVPAYLQCKASIAVLHTSYSDGAHSLPQAESQKLYQHICKQSVVNTAVLQSQSHPLNDPMLRQLMFLYNVHMSKLSSVSLCIAMLGKSHRYAS